LIHAGCCLADARVGDKLKLGSSVGMFEYGKVDAIALDETAHIFDCRSRDRARKSEAIEAGGEDK
jgi:hypothetical protein